MVLERGSVGLRSADVPEPRPGQGQVLIDVAACGVCRTDVHVVDGELPGPKLPLVPGHQVVGTVVATGPDVEEPSLGTRVGVPWLAWACGKCRQCLSGRENLCPTARFTGYTVDGGFAERIVAEAAFCLRVPDTYEDVDAAPLLCAGLIGHRALRLAGDPERIGLYGFGAAAHIVLQVARHEGRRVFAFVRGGDATARDLALGLGAEWAGDSTGPAPEPLDAAIIFAPAGELVPAALRAVGPGGAVVCAGIHMSDIPSFPYAVIWEERVLRSVANLTRADGRAFLALAPKVPVHTVVERFPLHDAGAVIERLRRGDVRGAAVLTMR